jgi:non-ribosomal peptide synthetase component E (peptide arylation enzyme)
VISLELTDEQKIPDTFSVVDALPRTSTDKTDYQALKASA